MIWDGKIANKRKVAKKKKVQSELRKFGIKQNYIGCNN